MADFMPPAGPPPPKVPQGWKAQWNDQYSEWFFVNIYTKKSQWDKPTEPVYPHPDPSDEAPPGPPPGYSGGAMHGDPTDAKHNPYKSSNAESDADLARRLQAEEDARAGSSSGHRGAQQDYMNSPMVSQQGSSPMPYQGQQLPPREQKKSGGFLGKLLGKASGSGGGGLRPQQQGYGGFQQQQPYGQQSSYGQGPQYGPQYGGYPQQGYGPGAYRPGYGGGYQQRPQKSGGMGMAGGAALGVGGGLVGGMLLANALDDDDYREGYQDGQEDGGDFGGDDGGGE